MLVNTPALGFAAKRAFHWRPDWVIAENVVCIFWMGALVQIAAAGTVHPLGVKLEGPEQLYSRA